MPIEFRINYQKLVEAITYILGKRNQQAMSIFILKCLYYADKFSLQQYAYPVTGDAYFKLKHGPCARAAYDILKHNDLYIPDSILALADGAFYAYNSKGVGDYNTIYKAKRPANTDYFSETDIECLNKSIQFCSEFANDYSLSDRSHLEEAWIQAKENGQLSYELMINKDVENRQEIIDYLKETSRSICL